MAEWLQMAASLVSVLMLCGVIFNFSVIKPLNESVRSLRDCIAELRRQLSDTEAKRQKMAERLSRVEALAEHAHADWMPWNSGSRNRGDGNELLCSAEPDPPCEG